ncbi:MAG: RNA polymerase sigma-70 factor [Bacteroidota bacterium]|nr:RNA polymerase sigma-70 factor [Flavisolibacter sp.]MBD0350422.1 RNA polymerase sigma-70 factor [Flavisolibacter sp.]MBD0374082.1 RNA polymerase sigma-70 factor [Flavisolibacter sp.]MDQ3843614.1 RNA polymerase sigma-70 factor [Bacteroidota bacterium]
MEQSGERDVMQYRPLLFSIAYNMLGSIMDAEDIVQDTFTYWYNTDQSYVENPKYYLIKAITNRCINHLKEAQRNRETYVGTWLPEPLVEKQKTDRQAIQFDNRNELSIGFLYLLEKLNPLERAVLILKESFDFPYSEIAQIFDISQDNCRQLLSRAKAKLKQEKNRFNVDKQKHNQILHKFLQACVSGNMEELVSLLKEDVAFYSDGGGKASAALHPLFGREKVLKFISGILKQTGPVSSIEIASVNGLSGAIIYIDKNNPVPDLLISLDVDEDDKIQNFYFIRNPDKLRHIAES